MVLTESLLSLAFAFQFGVERIVRAIPEGNMVVSDVVEVMNLFKREQQCHTYTMDWCITPSLIEEISRGIKMLEERCVCL